MLSCKGMPIADFIYKISSHEKYNTKVDCIDIND